MGEPLPRRNIFCLAVNDVRTPVIEWSTATSRGGIIFRHTWNKAHHFSRLFLVCSLLLWPLAFLIATFEVSPSQLKSINIRPGGSSDLNLQSNVCLVLAGPCELQLQVCKKLDQIPFSKCLKPAFWAIWFWYMHASLLIPAFFPEYFHAKASLCNCRPVAWNKCFFWTHRHCHCCAYCISNGFGLWPSQVHLYSVNTNSLTQHVASVLTPAKSHDVTCSIFTRSTHATWHNMCHLYSVNTNNLT